MEDSDDTETKTFYGRCLCCMEYGYMKDMWTEHSFEGEREVYGEMIMETFSIVCNQPDKMEHICEMCIMRLRESFSFKKEVQTSLGMLLDDYISDESDLEESKPIFLEDFKMSDHEDNDIQEPQTLCKIEPEYEEIEYLEEDEAVIATELMKPKLSTEKAPVKKWPKKKKKSGDLKTKYKNYTESDMRKCIEAVLQKKLSTMEASKKYNVPRKTISARLTYMKSKPDEWESQHHPTNERVSKRTRNVLLQKHVANIKAILRYTNATPFAGPGGSKYTCYFCKQDYNKPADLKTHTRSHSDVFDSFQIKDLTHFLLKLDITGLNCLLCRQSINNMEDLFAHLKSHRKLVYTDIKHQIVPFSFTDNIYRCVLCRSEYTFFKLLLGHMIEHYSIYSCSHCGKGFINKHTLSYHEARHDKGVYKCSYCEKEFVSRVNVKAHERVLHRHNSKTRKCRYCDERFMSGVQRNKHEVEHHGADQEIFPCNVCDKQFTSQFCLTGHINRCHLMLKRLQCTECDMRFYAKKGLNNHMLKHTQERNFQCDICLKRYGRKSTLKEHMRIHNNDRRFKCEICDKGFVQKCTLKGHMMLKHNIYI